MHYAWQPGAQTPHSRREKKLKKFQDALVLLFLLSSRSLALTLSRARIGVRVPRVYMGKCRNCSSAACSPRVCSLKGKGSLMAKGQVKKRDTQKRTMEKLPRHPAATRRIPASRCCSTFVGCSTTPRD